MTPDEFTELMRQAALQQTANPFGQNAAQAAMQGQASFGQRQAPRPLTLREKARMVLADETNLGNRSLMLYVRITQLTGLEPFEVKLGIERLAL